jgi:hypothetical protein
MPFIWSRRQTALGEGADAAADVVAGTGLLVEVMASEPGSTAEAAPTSTAGETRRDDRP